MPSTARFTRLRRVGFVAVAAGLLFTAPLPNASAADDDQSEQLVTVQSVLTGPQYLTSEGKPIEELRAHPPAEDTRIPPSELSPSTGIDALEPTSAEKAHDLALKNDASYGTPSEKFATDADPAIGTLAVPDYMTVEECRDHSDLSGRVEGWVKNHFSYCQIGVLQAAQYRCNWKVFCVNVGGFSARITHVGVGYQGLREIDWNIVVDDVTAWGWSANGRLTVRADCAGSTSDACESAYDRISLTVPQWRRDGTGWLYFNSPAQPPSAATGEQIKRGTFQFKYDFTTRAGTRTSSGPETSVRFDSAWYVSPKTGSIFDRVNPYLSYSTTDPDVKESAWHIHDAQLYPASTYPRVSYTKVIPGAGADKPLHRLYHDTERRRKNREDFAVPVCQSQWPGYSELSQDCDEYPFSATYEGAALSDYDGGPYGRFSVRPVLFSDNQAAGRRLGQWYDADRILDGDAFHIEIRTS